MMAKPQYRISRTSYKALRRGLEDLEAQREHYEAEAADQDCPSDDDINMFRMQTQQEQVENQIGRIRFVLDRAEILDDDPHPASIDPAKRGAIWENDEFSEPISKSLSSPKALQVRKDRRKGSVDLQDTRQSQSFRR